MRDDPMEKRMSILIEWGAANNLDLTIRFRPNFSDYSVHFALTEIKEGPFLSSECGHGSSVDEALQSYANQIRGKMLVFGAYTDKRKVLEVPNYMSHGNKAAVAA